MSKEIRQMIDKVKNFKQSIDENISSNNPSEYAGEHSAPEKENNDPMHNVINIFPDMYNENAYKYYGGQGLDDNAVINQIKSVHNRPRASVVIYRSVPNLNKDIDKKIKDLNYILNYKFKYGFFPMKNKTVRDLESDIWDKNPSLTYDEMQKQVYNEISKLVDGLVAQKEKRIKINDGDWVTTSKMYAKDHGENNLNNNYKIVTKTVIASQLYTDGNSVFEWGYNV